MTTTMTLPPATLPAAPKLAPMLPDNAPFTAAQRAWLNGFFAAILQQGSNTMAMPVAPESAAPAPVAPVAPEPEEMPWHDPAMPMAERMKLSEGKALPRVLMSAMAQLDCGACGYTCKTYSQAIADGKEKDLTRCTPGGRETSKMVKQLLAAAPATSSPAPVAVQVTSKGSAIADAPAKPAYDRSHPYSARLVESRPLNQPGSAKDTRLVVINLLDSGIEYKPGDALGVFPENCPDFVTELLLALGMTGAEDVPGWDGNPISLRAALTREFTITRPSPDLLDMLSRYARDPGEQAALEVMRDSEGGAGDLQIIDLVRKFPSARIPAGDFVAALSPLAPRLYSISSSLAANPGQVHLTVGTVKYRNSAGRDCIGVASTYLGARVQPGQPVRVFVHPSHKFALPESDKPIIMVGPGTGIAPFRAFLQERATTSCTAKNWLIFGDQKASTDFLFRHELEGYSQSGLLTRLDTAFSRDQDEKVYVQHRMLENGAELWAWINEGAHFYVCGDAKRMASDVDRALRQVIAQHGNLSNTQADAYVAQMIRDGRYQRDVY